MRKEYASLRRRPFLTPVWLIALTAALVLAAGIWALSVASTTIVVVVPVTRGGEWPDLVVAALGETRAALLAPLLAAGERPSATRPDALLVTQSVAATALAQPLARRLGLTPVTVPAGEPRRLAAIALGSHRGERVLVITEEAEVAALARALGRWCARRAATRRARRRDPALQPTGGARAGTALARRSGLCATRGHSGVAPARPGDRLRGLSVGR